MTDSFSDKLKLVLKVLVLSRTGLAAALNVDKSLVGRWAAGTVTPSEHNLANITRFVSERIPGFTLLDWDRDMNSFAGVLGVEVHQPHTSSAAEMIPSEIYEESLRTSQARAKAYEGLWLSTRASHDMPGRFIHDICLIQCREDGTIRFRVGVENVRYEGWSLMLQHQLFSIAFDIQSGTVMFGIFNGVARQKPDVLDGMNLATLQDAGGSPAASASLLQRMADLTGDAEADEALFEDAVAELNPLAPESAIPDEVKMHLTKNVTGPAPGILRLLFGDSMARGPRLDGRLPIDTSSRNYGPDNIVRL